MFRKPFDSVSITLIDAHSCVHIYASLVSAVRCSKVYLRAKLIRLHISPHSRLNQGPVPQSALKGWNIVFGHTNQFHLDHVLQPEYCDVWTYYIVTLWQLIWISSDNFRLTMCFDLGIVTCGPNEALVISGMFQGNTPSLLTGFPVQCNALKEIWLKALFLLYRNRVFTGGRFPIKCRVFSGGRFPIIIVRWQGHCLSGSSDPSANWSHHHDPGNQVSFSVFVFIKF